MGNKDDANFNMNGDKPRSDSKDRNFRRDDRYENNDGGHYRGRGRGRGGYANNYNRGGYNKQYRNDRYNNRENQYSEKSNNPENNDDGSWQTTPGQWQDSGKRRSFDNRQNFNNRGGMRGRGGGYSSRGGRGGYNQNRNDYDNSSQSSRDTSN